MNLQRTITAALVILLIIGGAIWMIRSLRPRRVTLEEATQQTRRLISKAGGTGQICDEAQRIFARFGSSKLKIFYRDDLKGCSSLPALGKVDGIWPDYPPYIKIRVGNHIKGFQIDIVERKPNSNGPGPPGAVQVEDCIYVVR